MILIDYYYILHSEVLNWKKSVNFHPWGGDKFWAFLHFFRCSESFKNALKKFLQEPHFQQIIQQEIV